MLYSPTFTELPHQFYLDVCCNIIDNLVYSIHMSDHCHAIPKTALRPELCGLWNGPVWGETPFLGIGCFRPESTSHRPFVRCKMVYDDSHLYGLFLVEDRYIRCVHTGFQAPVYEDSCVELFVQPKPDRGYFNFEFNCGGALLASYVTDPTRIDGRMAEATPLSLEEGWRVAVYSSLPSIIEPEIKDEVTWLLEFSMPFALLTGYVGSLGKMEGQQWRGNLYKSGNRTSRPHWASWVPLSDRNFHAPWDFGELRFIP
jgi:hypothetical protein